MGQTKSEASRARPKSVEEGNTRTKLVLVCVLYIYNHDVHDEVHDKNATEVVRCRATTNTIRSGKDNGRHQRGNQASIGTNKSLRFECLSLLQAIDKFPLSESRIKTVSPRSCGKRSMFQNQPQNSNFFRDLCQSPENRHLTRLPEQKSPFPYVVFHEPVLTSDRL
ncbi:hypothetical protein SISSUDRAFT_887012 [Sistotremastrum suecicum HHB10207 ss-3]|uniref:Uncharacterized protein n=1 Tax=Sistotremastrum suecicum HHB10207 ss-3 TaxID=1314776 RepID=A0A166C559_9AGAM|nr:hypothetical protein SISSUDRAFT_887012 [Sistotremastrum suecicum HHB10207 ss-3]